MRPVKGGYSAGDLDVTALPPPPPSICVRPDCSHLLSSVADALNACEAAGHSVKLAHGAVLTPAGYVLPVYPDAGERFAVRTMALTEFPVTGPDEDEPCGV